MNQNTVTVKINDTAINVPQSWNDLALKDQMFIYGILMTDTHKIFEPHELLSGKKIIIVQHLLNLNPEFVKEWAAGRIKEYGQVEGETVFLSELDALIKTMDFLFIKLEKEKETDPDQYQINLGLTKCPYPRIDFPGKKRKNKRWYGPADKLANISIYELGTLFTLFEKFMKTGKEEFAERLIATMYRPSKAITKPNKKSAYNGDRRLPLLHHEATIDGRIKQIQQKDKDGKKILPQAFKQITLFWFASCRQEIIESFPNVFSTNDDNPWGEQNSGNNYGWGGVLLSLADGLVNLDNISQQNHNDALTYLSYLEDQRKAQVLRQASVKK